MVFNYYTMKLFTFLLLFISTNSFSNEALVHSTFGWKTEHLNPGDFKRLEIVYDFDKADIRPESKALLDSVAVFMNCHPYAVFYIENHTDSRGNDQYNSKLTGRRSKAIVDYLISKGIFPNRLEAVGKGESELIYSDVYIKENAKTKPEQEKLHQINRRTVLKVRSIDYKSQPLDEINLTGNYLEADTTVLHFLMGEKANKVELSRFEKAMIHYEISKTMEPTFLEKIIYLFYKDETCKLNVLIFEFQPGKNSEGLLANYSSITKFRWDICEKKLVEIK